MRCYPSLKSLLEWSSLGIFLFLLFAAFMVSHGNDGGWTTVELEEAKTVDNGDIETKVAPQKSGSGVVWGTVQQTPPATPVPAATTVPSLAAPKPVTANTAPALPSTTATTPTLPSATPAKTAPAVAAPALTQPLPQPAVQTPGKYLLKSGRRKGSTDLVETLLEVSGEAKQIAADLKETREKMEVVAGFRYEERTEQFTPTMLSSVRQYNLAKSKMKIGKDERMPELASELQTIVCSVDRDNVSLFSPHGSLRGEQLLLIEDLPGNTLTIDRLLPNTEVAIGESWKIGDSVLRSFLSIDAVIASNVEAVLTAVADDMAMVDVIGDISGIYLGASTEMSVRAKFQFDLSSKRINWLGVIIEENRTIGHVGPGLEHVAKLQVKISPLDTPQVLTDAAMMVISTLPSSAVLQLKYDGGKGPWRFSHDRTWYVYQDDPQTTVLRKLVDGELVAQCNVADMGTVDLQTMSTIEKFQQDLVAGLGNSFGKVAAAGEYTDRQGYKIYKVLLDGMVDDLALRWIYHLITDKNGRQSVVVFVVEASMLDQFGNADDALLETYRMGR